MTTVSREQSTGEGAGTFNFARPNTSDRERMAILDAAASAFFEHGFNDTSVDEIADRLGASKGQVYHYYRSKSDILFDIQQTTTDTYLGAVTPIAESDRPCDERLWLMAREHALLVVRSVSYARVTLFATSVHNYRTEQQRRAHSAIAVRRKEYENLFVSVLSEGVTNGTFRDLDLGLASKAMLGSLNWIAYWYAPGSEKPTTQENIAMEMADYVVTAVSFDTSLLEKMRTLLTTSAS